MRQIAGEKHTKKTCSSGVQNMPLCWAEGNRKHGKYLPHQCGYVIIMKLMSQDLKCFYHWNQEMFLSKLFKEGDYAHTISNISVRFS